MFAFDYPHNPGHRAECAWLLSPLVQRTLLHRRPLSWTWAYRPWEPRTARRSLGRYPRIHDVIFKIFEEGGPILKIEVGRN